MKSELQNTGSSLLNKYLIVFNPLPNKKRLQIVKLLQTKLQQQNMVFDLYPTDVDLAVNQQFFKANIQQYSDVIVVGGDGTFNCVINCLICCEDQLGAELSLGKNIRFGLVPAGTGNDFARMWYGGRNNKKNRHRKIKLDEILEIVTSNNTQTISLGECVFTEKNELNQYQNKRIFHNVMGTGFDSQLSKALRYDKSKFKSLSYLLSAIRHVPFYQEKTSSFVIDGKTQKYKNLITTFANGRYFGGGLKVAPQANPLSRELDVVQVAKHTLWVKLKLVILLCLGKHLSAKQVTYRSLQSRSYIDTVGLDLQADGEYIGQSPCSIAVIENALKLKR